MNGYKCYCEPSRDYEDCRYYSVAFDMGANIAHCTLNPPDGMEALSYCPCIDNKGKCKQYISKKDPNGDFIAGQQRMADRVLEIIDSLKEFNMGAHKSVLNMISDEILALKGGEQG